MESRFFCVNSISVSGESSFFNSSMELKISPLPVLAFSEAVELVILSGIATAVVVVLLTISGSATSGSSMVSLLSW